MQLRILLAAAPFLALGSCAQQEAAAASSAEAPHQSVRIGITGMT